MKKAPIQLFFTLFCFHLLTQPLLAQRKQNLDIAQTYLQENRLNWQLKPLDIANLRVSDYYFSQHNGLTHIFFNQQFENIDIHNAITGIHASPEGKVVYATNGFYADIASLMNTTSPSISAEEAIQFAAKEIGVKLTKSLSLIRKTPEQTYFFKGENISNHEIKVSLVFQPILHSNTFRLAWKLYIDPINDEDIWGIRVDALNGDILARNNLTLYCNSSIETHHEACEEDFTPSPDITASHNFTFNDNASYKVIPFPLESPLDGSRETLINPSDGIASPFGWHDVDGIEGAEYEITRGNNVHAFIDVGEAGTANEGEPEGGPSLSFIFPFDELSEPDAYRDASTTQLFYSVNALHDLSYHYGFDEGAGNFQTKNYSGEGEEGDYIKARGQKNVGFYNNASFGTSYDGTPGRISVLLWDRVDTRQALNVLSPNELAGNYQAGLANFGPAVTTQPITGLLVEVLDGNYSSLGCEEIINAAALNGNIALIERGECSFEEKVLNAQAAGAIAVILCNNKENTLYMKSGVADVDPVIPTISLKKSTCQQFRQLIDEGIMVEIVIPDEETPVYLDGNFDNGLITHEFAHAISLRLTGGASQPHCLDNYEQMGEGWSDFFTLALTVKEGDVGETPRGVDNYLLRAGSAGAGIRRSPYSTDLAINDLTYDYIINTGFSPHALGEVWTAMLWDLYWAFVDEYGFDEDQVNGNGGNNMVIQLIIDGLKLQGCSPGFIEGRDAILAADAILNDGQNECLIWKAFAKRGLGYFADGGSTLNRFDGTQNFDAKPTCIKALKITKEVTPLLNAGEEISVTLTIVNHKDQDLSNLMITDELESGTHYIIGSSNGANGIETDNILTFEVESLAAGQSFTIQYLVSTDAALPSTSTFYDNMETSEDDWLIETIEGNSIWGISSENAHSGEKSWFVTDTGHLKQQQILNLLSPITVPDNQPVLRFYHNFVTLSGIDGGFMQISRDGGSNWEYVDVKLFRNKYSRLLSIYTIGLPNINAFSGDSNGFIDSYIDLSDYVGEEIFIRFKFGAFPGLNFGTNETERMGWYVDDVEVLEMINYNSEVCVIADEGDEACAVADEGGTIIEVDRLTSTENPVFEADIRLFPNPAAEKLTVSFAPKRATEVSFDLISTEGRTVFSHQEYVGEGRQNVSLNIANVPTGFYFVKISSDNEIFTKKIVIQ